MTAALRAAGLVSIVVLTACTGFSPSPSSSSAAIRPNAAIRSSLHPSPRKSWLASDIGKTSQLLFVTDPGLNVVDIFALPDLNQKGRLTGFEFPLGACSDNHGDVWIANYFKHEMLEYSHAGTLRSKIVRTGLQPAGCAVNPVTGALAVVESDQLHPKPGDVLVFSSPSAAPVVLRNPEQEQYFNAAYDSKGNLWVTGYGTEYPMLSKCGATSCQTVILHGGSIFSPGAVVWDNSKNGLIVFDQYCHDGTMTCSYPVSTSGAVGAPTTYLSATGSPLCGMYGAAVATAGTSIFIVGSDNEYVCTGYTSSSVDVWTYPTGGSPANARTAVVYPWGAAISTK